MATRNARRKTIFNQEAISKKVGKRLSKKGVAIDDDTRDATVDAVFTVLRSALISKRRDHRDIMDLPGICRMEVVDMAEKPVRAPRATENPWRAKGATRTVKIKLLPALKAELDERFAKSPSKKCQTLADEKNGIAPAAEEDAPKKKTDKKKTDKKKNKKNK